MSLHDDYNEVTRQSGSRSAQGRRIEPAAIRKQAQPQNVHPGPALRDPSSPNILQDGFSRGDRDTGGQFRIASSSEPQEAPSLQYALQSCETLRRKRGYKGLFDGSVARARALGLLETRVECAIDATGFESRYVSKHYVWRSSSRPYHMSKWPKLTAAVDVASHVTLAIHRCMGPCQDSPQFAPTMREAARRQPFSLVLGDKGYDAEENHRLCREELGADSTIIAVRKNTNGTRQWPKTPYRREMKRPKNREGYGQRWQVESAFSANKRLLGTALRARTWIAQKAEMAIRVLTHNFMLCGNV